MPEDLSSIEESMRTGQPAPMATPPAAPNTDTNPTPAALETPEFVDRTSHDATIAERDATIAKLTHDIAERNINFDKRLAELAEREDEFAQAITELKNREDPPDSQLTQSGRQVSFEEMKNDPNYADYLILDIGLRNRDRRTPGFRQSVHDMVFAEEKKAGRLAGFSIGGVTY